MLDSFTRDDVTERKMLHCAKCKRRTKGMNAKELVAGMNIIEGLLEKLYNGPARHETTIKKVQAVV